MNLGIFDADNAVPFRMVRRVYNTAGTFFYRKPANLIAVDVEVEGGHADGAADYGGGAGGYSRRLIPTQSLPSGVTVVVGANGTTGGTSSFGSFASATGGSSTGAGSGSGGDINLRGQAAFGGQVPYGCGLPAYRGFAGPGRLNGGGGTTGAGSGGGPGTAGAVVVTEYLKGAA